MISQLLQTAFAMMMNYFYRPEANSHEEPMTSVHTPWDWVTQETFRRAVVKAQGIPHCFEDDVYEAIELERLEAEAYERRLRCAQLLAAVAVAVLLLWAVGLLAKRIVAFVSSGGLGRLVKKKQGPQENFEEALREHPELFDQCAMFFLTIEVNGHKVRALVDTGANSTVLSAETALRCELDRVLDTRFSGATHGIGAARMLGRVHVTPVKIGSRVVATSVVVLDELASGFDCLLGTDVLGRLDARLDMHKSSLQFGNTELRLLPSFVVARKRAPRREPLELKADPQAVRANRALLMEQHPELLFPVGSFKVPVMLNGCEVTALVDTGAQRSSITAAVARDCGLLQLLDERFAGEASGVGRAQILGRVNLTRIRIGQKNQVPIALTVLGDSSGVGLILGLDMIMTLRAIVDTRVNCVEFGDTLVPFLA